MFSSARKYLKKTPKKKSRCETGGVQDLQRTHV
jgi:hypothetical protein